MKVVGVTGGAGFIGTWVVKELAAKGYEPLIFDHLGRGDGHVMLGDVRDPVAVTELAAHCDGVIHLAAVLGTQETIKNPTPAVRSNIEGGLNYLEAVTQYDLPGVNICVGNWWMDNPYSISKNTVERLGAMYRRDRGARVANVRVVNAYGPGQMAAAPFGPGKVRKIMPAFICRALSGQPIEVYGDGSQVSDCVFVGDVARALVATLETVERGEDLPTIEVGPAVHSTVLDVAKLVRDVAAEKLNLVPLPKITHAPMRPGEKVGTPVTCNPYTLEHVGIDPLSLTSLVDGIYATVDWFDTNRGVTWS